MVFSKLQREYSLYKIKQTTHTNVNLLLYGTFVVACILVKAFLEY